MERNHVIYPDLEFSGGQAVVKLVHRPRALKLQESQLLLVMAPHSLGQHR